MLGSHNSKSCVGLISGFICLLVLNAQASFAFDIPNDFPGSCIDRDSSGTCTDADLPLPTPRIRIEPEGSRSITFDVADSPYIEPQELGLGIVFNTRAYLSDIDQFKLATYGTITMKSFPRLGGTNNIFQPTFWLTSQGGNVVIDAKAKLLQPANVYLYASDGQVVFGTKSSLRARSRVVQAIGYRGVIMNRSANIEAGEVELNSPLGSPIKLDRGFTITAWPNNALKGGLRIISDSISGYRGRLIGSNIVLGSDSYSLPAQSVEITYTKFMGVQLNSSLTINAEHVNLYKSWKMGTLN